MPTGQPARRPTPEELPGSAGKGECIFEIFDRKSGLLVASSSLKINIGRIFSTIQEI